MREQTENQKPYVFRGMNNCFVCVILLVVLALFSLLGYFIGVSNIVDPPLQPIKVEIRNDSTLKEIIRNQTNIEMEMLRIIGERNNIAPIIKNNVYTPKSCAHPKIINSFNNNSIKDSL